MSISPPAPGVVGPFAGLDVPGLLRMRGQTRRDHPFLIWAPFEAPARIWAYGEFHERVGALAAGLKTRGVRPGEYLLIHLDNCIEAMLASSSAPLRLPPTPAPRRRRWNILRTIAARLPRSPSRPMPRRSQRIAETCVGSR